MNKVNTYELRTLFTVVAFAIVVSLCVFAGLGGADAYGEQPVYEKWAEEAELTRSMDPTIKELDILVESLKEVEADNAVIEEVEEDLPEYFDVPLDEALQDHIFALCKEREFDPAIVVAMIERESYYNPLCMGDNGASYGLMQIQPRWHQARMDKLGCTNLLDPYQNVTVGLDYLVELSETGKGIEWVLMAYNGGPSYANRKAKEGRISGYASWVLDKHEVLSRK